MQKIRRVEKESPELTIIRELFREYEKELGADLRFQNFGNELENPLKKYGSPNGVLFLCYWNDEPAGCIGLAPMEETGYCEMKRLFVRPVYRKYGIGKTLVYKLIEFATGKGYQFMRLDTFKKLAAAIRLYETLDFYYIESYYHNPYPDVVYMEKRLLKG
ncbi:MAG: GNAT family N-acetyltransferase [Chitinophagaceae bacterium]|nr:GNAT family N-acetyltransferase [Chitinophagaceae bacterium]